MSCLGLDIGGANLKAANTTGWAKAVPFALWRNPFGLADALRELIAAAPPANRLAITMTGELCDCFRNKAEGVRHILAAVNNAAHDRMVSVYLSDGRYVSIEEANKLPHLAAASNWRALAELVCRETSSNAALLIDIGSTTTDIVPILRGQVAARGFNDTHRLACGELVYSGVGRTPVCAVTNRLPYRGSACRVAAEVFSTTADAYLVLGEISEDPTATWTADGRPLTDDCSRQRLARQLCGDVTDFEAGEIEHVAAFVRNVQKREIGRAIRDKVNQMAIPVEVFVISGGGEFLAHEVVAELYPTSPVLAFSARLGGVVSGCAPAYAVAAGGLATD